MRQPLTTDVAELALRTYLADTLRSSPAWLVRLQHVWQLSGNCAGALTAWIALCEAARD
jgi:hypothetical protein